VLESVGRFFGYHFLWSDGLYIMELYFQNARHEMDTSFSDVAIIVFVLDYPSFQDLFLRKVALFHADKG